jgi:hypothetical protein
MRIPPITARRMEKNRNGDIRSLRMKAEAKEV